MSALASSLHQNSLSRGGFVLDFIYLIWVCFFAAESPERRSEAVAWLRSLLAGSGLPLPPPHASDHDLRAALADGAILAAALRRLGCASTPDQVRSSIARTTSIHRTRARGAGLHLGFGFVRRAVIVSYVVGRRCCCREEPRRRPRGVMSTGSSRQWSAWAFPALPPPTLTRYRIQLLPLFPFSSAAGFPY